LKTIISVTLEPEMVEQIDRLKSGYEQNRSLTVRALLREALLARANRDGHLSYSPGARRQDDDTWILS
jgi:metal-responsive CopG/Arc/MetJ family transcriptional regulator